MPNSISVSSATIDDEEVYDSDTESSQSLLAHGTDYEQQSLYNGTDVVPRPEPMADRARRKSFIQEDEDPLQIDMPVKKKQKYETVSWMSLPHKSQLAILTVARLSEPLVQTSLRSYLFYQLKSFDKTLPDSVIASQAGIMQGSFAAAQLCTAMLWGRVSDRGGRKRVLLIGLSGTTISCIGFGLSTSFWQAMCFRMLAGALNGNVGVMRTMISEIVREKKYQSRAFLLLPMCSNVGSIIGPILGGLLADPAANYPQWFGNIQWLKKHPYAPPNFLSATFLICAWLWVFFGLDETHELYSNNTDYGRTVTQRIFSVFQKIGSRKPVREGHRSIDQSEEEPLLQPTKPPKLVAPRYKNKLPMGRIFTKNVIFTLIAHGLLTGSQGTFNNIWYSFLSTPAYDPSKPPPHYTPHPPFIFTGGIGLPPRSVGFAMAILGSIGITLQLFIYPIVNARIGTVRSWRIFLYCFPIVYILAPLLSLLPSTTPPPSEKTGPVIWFSLSALLLLQVIGKTFAGPATTILVNNCSPHPSVLGTIHGIGQSASSAAKTVGPAFGGWLYGYGLSHGFVGLAFWVLACVAACSCVASNWVREGDGHEIRLEGDDEAEEEAQRANVALGF